MDAIKPKVDNIIEPNYNNNLRLLNLTTLLLLEVLRRI